MDFVVKNGVLTHYEGDDTCVIVPEGITEIRSFVFKERTNIKSITLPVSLRKIGESAFYGCTGIQKIFFHTKVVTIEKYAFCNCTGLTNIVFPVNSTIKAFAFSGCTSLASVELPKALERIEKETFKNCTALTSIIWPRELKSIGISAFEECKGLTSLLLPESIVCIKSKAFYGCTGLTFLSLPESIEEIGSKAFYGCTGLQNVELPFGYKEKTDSIFGTESEINIKLGVDSALIELLYAEVVSKYRIRKHVTDIADDTGDSGMGYEWNKSYVETYIPSKESMVVRNGKLVGFCVSYNGESDLLYIDKGSAIVVVTDTGRYKDYCHWTLEKL